MELGSFLEKGELRCGLVWPTNDVPSSRPE